MTSSQPKTSSAILLTMVGVGAAGVALTWLGGARERFWINWIYWFLVLFTVGIGSLFIVAVQHLVSARWSIPVRRVPERLSTLLLPAIPVAAIALAAVRVLYPGAQPEALQNKLLAGKVWWLDLPMFSLRTAIVLVLCVLGLFVLVRGSLRQDHTKDYAFNVRAKKFAPGFMVLFAFMVSIIAFDWVSGLTPDWYSDIFGVYLFAGSFLAGLAASTLAVLYLKRNQRLTAVRRDHLYNLGAFTFAFTVFWSYIGFAQYMLMWYANLPEEIHWYHQRLHGGWHTITIVLAVVHFVVPFFALSTRDSKSDPKRLVVVALIMMGAHLLDLYWLLFPNLGHPVFSWSEASFALLFLGGGLFWVQKSLGWGEDMPVGDPFLREGLEFRL